MVKYIELILGELSLASESIQPGLIKLGWPKFKLHCRFSLCEVWHVTQGQTLLISQALLTRQTPLISQRMNTKKYKYYILNCCAI